MIRKVLFAAVFGLLAVAFAGYGIYTAHRASVAAHVSGSQYLEKDFDYGGGLLF